MSTPLLSDAGGSGGPDFDHASYDAIPTDIVEGRRQVLKADAAAADAAGGVVYRRLPRLTLLAVNTFYLVMAGVIAAAVGAITREGGPWHDVIPHDALVALIAAAFLLTLSALAGCYGALAESRMILGIYALVAGVTLILQLAAAASVMAFISGVDGPLSGEFKDGVTKAYDECCPPARACSSGNFSLSCSWASGILATEAKCDEACASVVTLADEIRALLKSHVKPLGVAVLGLCVPQLLAVICASVIVCRHKAPPTIVEDDEEVGPEVDPTDPEPELTDWPFVLVFLNPEKIKKPRARARAEKLLQSSCRAMLDKKLRIYLYYSSTGDEIFCKVAASLDVLKEEADRTNYLLRLDPAALKAADMAKNRLRAKAIAHQRALRPRSKPTIQLTVPEDPLLTGSPYNPYRFIHAKYERSAPQELYRRCRHTRTIFRVIDIDYLIVSILEDRCKIVLDDLAEYFPLHDEDVRQRLKADWYRWLGSPWDQPLDRIRNYCGEKIALYFGWLGHYTKWLLAPAFVGLVVYVHQRTVDNANVKELPLFGVFIAVWATLFLEYWKRLQNTLSMKWGMTQFEEEEQKRPTFLLHPNRIEAPSGVTGLREVGYSQTKYRSKIIISQIVVAVMVFIVLMCVAGIFVLRAFVVTLENKHDVPVGTAAYTASIVNAVQIQVLNLVYGKVASKLNDWENHKTDTIYEDNLIAKTFLFQFINSYFSLFYIAFIKNHVTLFGTKQQCQLNAHGEVDCVAELSNQLGVILVSRLVTGNFTEIVLPYIKDWIAERRERHKREKAAEEAREEGGELEPEPEVSTAEEQNDMDDYNVFDDFSEMAIQYGYITLFVVAFPLAPLFALVSNYVEIRVDALKLLDRCCRPTPAGAEDIGTWYSILDVIGRVAVITNVAVVVFTSSIPAFGVTDPLNQVWLFVILEHAIFALKFVFDRFVPDMPAEVLLQLERQSYLVAKHIDNVDVDEDALGSDLEDDAAEAAAAAADDAEAGEASLEEVEITMTVGGVDKGMTPTARSRRAHRRTVFRFDDKDNSPSVAFGEGATSGGAAAAAGERKAE